MTWWCSVILSPRRERATRSSDRTTVGRDTSGTGRSASSSGGSRMTFHDCLRAEKPVLEVSVLTSGLTPCWTPSCPGTLTAGPGLTPSIKRNLSNNNKHNGLQLFVSPSKKRRIYYRRVLKTLIYINHPAQESRQLDLPLFCSALQDFSVISVSVIITIGCSW